LAGKRCHWASDVASTEEESAQMGIFDKAKDALGDNPDEVERGMDKAADFADDRAGAARTGQLDAGADVAEDKVGDNGASTDEAQSLPDPTEAGSPPAGSPEPPD
jgi:hypothetical protein